MKARLAALVLVIIVQLYAGATQAAFAQSITIETEATYRFGEDFHFAARVEGPSPITRAAVFLRPESADTARVVLADISSEDPSLVQADVELAQLSIFAFETLYYWWQIDFSSGGALTTDVEKLEYMDDRFAWQFISTDDVHISWHDRSLSEGQAILEITQLALDQIAQSYALGQTAPLRIIVYNSAQELQSALHIVGISSAVGHAEPELGLVLISAVSSTQGLVDLERLIPHELVHLLISQSGPSGAVEYPTWLSEGMATMVEGAPSPARRAIFEDALRSKKLFRFVDLCTAFPISTEAAQLAYGQSASFMRYLVDVYGVGGIQALLSAYQEGVSCTGGVQRVFQRSLDQLQAEWQDTIAASSSNRTYILWAVGLIALLISAITIFVIRRRSSSTSQIEPQTEDVSA